MLLLLSIALAAPPTLLSPCVVDGAEVSCWGDDAGGLAPAPVQVLAGLTDLRPLPGGACGRATPTDTEWTCWPARPTHWPEGPVLDVSREGGAQCLLLPGKKLRCGYDDPVTLPLVPAEVHAVDCGEKWLALDEAGTVHLAPGCGELIEPATDVVQVDVADGVLCTRTRAGDARCQPLPDHRDSWGIAERMATFGTRPGTVDVATGGRTACALSSTGEAWCTTDESDKVPGHVEGQPTKLPFQGVRDLSLLGGQLCVLDGEGVACAGLGARAEFQDQAVQVQGLPPVRTADLRSDIGCAVTKTGELWCWGELDDLDPDGGPSYVAPPRKIADEVHDVRVGTRWVFWLDTQGRLQARGRTEVAPTPLWTEPVDGVSLAWGYWYPTPFEGGMDVVCAVAPPTARCLGQREHRTRFETLPTPGPVKQVVAGEPLCLLTPEGAPQCISQDLERWLDADQFTWKDPPQERYAFTHAESFYLVDDQGRTTTCDLWEGTWECGKPRLKKVDDAVAQSTSWVHDRDGAVWRVSPDGPTKVLADAAQVRDGFAYDFVAWDHQGRVFVFLDDLRNGYAGPFGARGRWTRLTPPSP